MDRAFSEVPLKKSATLPNQRRSSTTCIQRAVSRRWLVICGHEMKWAIFLDVQFFLYLFVRWCGSPTFSGKRESVVLPSPTFDTEDSVKIKNWLLQARSERAGDHLKQGRRASYNYCPICPGPGPGQCIKLDGWAIEICHQTGPVTERTDTAVQDH